MEKNFIDEKILGLAYRTIPHEIREKLSRNGIDTTRRLLTTDDEKLSRLGIARTHITALDRLLKKNGLKRTPERGPQKALLRILTEDSVIGTGCFADRKVRDLIQAQRFRVLRRLYYTVANIDFTPSVKEAVNIRITIPKPGTDTDAMRRCDEENEANLHGDAKLKLISQISKQMRTERSLKNKSEAMQFTKTRLQAMNHGHLNAGLSEEKETEYDTRLFAGIIIKHGYDSNMGRRGATWQEKAAAYYKEVLASIPETFIPEGRDYLAWERFRQYVEATYPNETRTIYTAVPPPEYMVPDYFSTLDSLGLGYRDRLAILSAAEKRFSRIILKEQSSGEDILLKGCSVVTERTNTDPMLRLCIFEEDTFERTEIRQRLRKAAGESAPSMEEYAAIMDKASAIISLRNIEAMLTAAITDSEGGLKTFVKRKGSGRQAASFELRIKNGSLQIRECKNGLHPIAYQSFGVWAKENTPLLESLHQRIAGSEIL